MVAVSFATNRDHFQLLDPRLSMKFWDRVSAEPNSGCWLWIGAVNNNAPHAVPAKWWLKLKREADTNRELAKTLNKLCEPAHRLAYQALVGPIPAALQALHRCNVSLCVNPRHLVFVTGPHLRRILASRSRRALR